MTVPVKSSRDNGSEPRLSDMLDDPIVHALMVRDGVDRSTLERLIAVTRQRLELQPLFTPRQAFEAALFAECAHPLPR